MPGKLADLREWSLDPEQCPRTSKSELEMWGPTLLSSLAACGILARQRHGGSIEARHARDPAVMRTAIGACALVKGRQSGRPPRRTKQYLQDCAIDDVGYLGTYPGMHADGITREERVWLVEAEAWQFMTSSALSGSVLC